MSKIDYKTLVNGMSLIKTLSDVMLYGDSETKNQAMYFYQSFRLAADGFMEVSFAAKEEMHKTMISSELDKYISEIHSILETEAKDQGVSGTIIKFPKMNNSTDPEQI